MNNNMSIEELNEIFNQVGFRVEICETDPTQYKIIDMIEEKKNESI